MARQKKPIVIEQYEDKGRGITFPICYNSNPGKNYHEATVQGETFTHLEIGEVRKWVAARIALLYSVSWQAVIEVRFDTGSQQWTGLDQRSSLQFDFGRFWVGRVTSGGLRRADWGKEAEIPWRSSFDRDQGPRLPEDRRVESSKDFWIGRDAEFAPPMIWKCRYGGESGNVSYYYPYSDELWSGLEGVKGEVQRIGILLKNLLSVDGDAYLALTTIGVSNLLAATATMP